ncbi:hypothetical protein ACRQ5Q_42800 (plasmid) [Bradyrhizobium sp. PMVTL-01]|uniref:hypothetical protein n=1 Tax=Bradyrhizobium sp. PMVTL-01 TaxID=3434999 RepID=UPI003F7175AC
MGDRKVLQKLRLSEIPPCVRMRIPLRRGSGNWLISRFYDVTVQVSDGNGGIDTQAIAVNVASLKDWRR